MDNEQSLSPIIEKLESLFLSINNYFYQGELQKPIITISSNNRKVNCLGWCTSWKAWDNSDKQSGYGISGYYEINICAEYLDRPFKEICNAMLHEIIYIMRNLISKILAVVVLTIINILEKRQSHMGLQYQSTQKEVLPLLI